MKTLGGCVTGGSKCPYLLVELANSHAGDRSKLESLVSEFGRIEYPAKGVKFQIFSPDGIALSDYDWFDVYGKLHFTQGEWKDIFEKAKGLGDIWVDIFDSYGLEVVCQSFDLVKGLKFQASVLENLEIYNSLLSMNLEDKIIIVNVSGYDLSKVDFFVEKFRKLSKYVVIQVGFQAYPTTVKDTGLQKISILRAAYPELCICLADHADASTDFALQVPLYGALLGCDYIEKHFCLDRATAEYDAYSALEPSEMLHLCESLKNIASAMTGGFLGEAERTYLQKSIQIPVAQKDLGVGSMVSDSDIRFRRTNQVGMNLDAISELQRDRKVLLRDIEINQVIRREDFKDARVGVIVACRMKSTRLKDKAILSIAGVPSVERCLHQCLAIKGVDTVILATSNEKDDAVLSDYTLGGKIHFWRGDAEDVVNRYLGACEEFDVDVVVRVTADCPLVLPDIIEFLLEKHFKSGADYTGAQEAAVGTTGEVINAAALRKVSDYFGKAELSEYMTWYFRNNSDRFKNNIVELPEYLIRDYRLTLDYPEDLMMFERLYEKLETDCSDSYTADEVFRVLDEDPSIPAINNSLPLKYKVDKELIAKLDLETRMKD